MIEHEKSPRNLFPRKPRIIGLTTTPNLRRRVGTSEKDRLNVHIAQNELVDRLEYDINCNHRVPVQIFSSLATRAFEIDLESIDMHGDYIWESEVYDSEAGNDQVSD